MQQDNVIIYGRLKKKFVFHRRRPKNKISRFYRQILLPFLIIIFVSSQLFFAYIYSIPIFLSYTGCPKNGVLTVHYAVEEITVNARKMFKKFYWTYLLIWRSLKVALNRSIILKYMYEIVMHDSYV
jgi:hypothetical protein